LPAFYEQSGAAAAAYWYAARNRCIYFSSRPPDTLFAAKDEFAVSLAGLRRYFHDVKSRLQGSDRSGSQHCQHYAPRLLFRQRRIAITQIAAPLSLMATATVSLIDGRRYHFDAMPRR